MPICHWVLAGPRGELYGEILTHPSKSVNPDALATAAAKDGEVRHFDAEQTILEASVDEEIHIEIPEEY